MYDTDEPPPLDVDAIELRAKLAPDVHLISHARSDISLLVNEVRDLRTQLKTYSKGLQSVCKAHLEATREIHRLNRLLEGKVT